MRLLIDTECWLWSLTDPDRLNDEARELIANRKSTIYLSAVSSWEIAIKAALGKLNLPEKPERYVPSRMAMQGISALPIEHAHALRVFSLPHHHSDPFDRMLVAQAQMESLSILTADTVFRSYDVATIWGGRRQSP